MIKDYQKFLNAVHVLLDMAVTACAFVLAFIVQFVVRGRTLAPMTAGRYFGSLLLILPLYLLLYAIFQLYRPKRTLGRRLEAWSVLQANAIGLLVILAYLYISRYNNYSRALIAFFFAINTVGLILERNLLRWLLRRLRRSGFNQKQVLLVGFGRTAQGFIDRVKANPQWGFAVRGILDDSREWGTDYKGVKVIGTITELEEILSLNRLDEVLITLDLAEYAKLGRIVYLCEKSGVHTMFIPDYSDIIPTRPYTEDLLGLPLVHIRHVPLTGALNRTVKRAMDLVGSALAIVLFSPVMLAVAFAVKVSSPGPVIYKQERVGLHNRPFRMYKFRSMAMIPASEEKTKWTTQGDDRVTAVGKFIRKTSLDELPQLFNVFAGSMSLVGPRPERPFFVEKFREEIPRYMVKHQVRPGMTGWAQVNGLRGDTSIRKRIEYDLFYIENWSVGFDIKILFLTVFRGFVNKNAY